MRTYYKIELFTDDSNTCYKSKTLEKSRGGHILRDDDGAVKFAKMMLEKCKSCTYALIFSDLKEHELNLELKDIMPSYEVTL